MTPLEVRNTVERGNKMAAAIGPLHPDNRSGFRFPYAVKEASNKFGVNTAAEIALECSKGGVGYAQRTMDEARNYVKWACRQRDKTEIVRS